MQENPVIAFPLVFIVVIFAVFYFTALSAKKRFKDITGQTGAEQRNPGDIYDDMEQPPENMLHNFIREAQYDRPGKERQSFDRPGKERQIFERPSKERQIFERPSQPEHLRYGAAPDDEGHDYDYFQEAFYKAKDKGIEIEPWSLPPERPPWGR